MKRRAVYWTGLATGIILTFALGIIGADRTDASGQCLWESMGGGAWQLIGYGCNGGGCSSPGLVQEPGAIESTPCSPGR